MDREWLFMVVVCAVVIAAWSVFAFGVDKSELFERSFVSFVMAEEAKDCSRHFFVNVDTLTVLSDEDILDMVENRSFKRVLVVDRDPAVNAFVKENNVTVIGFEMRDPGKTILLRGDCFVRRLAVQNECLVENYPVLEKYLARCPLSAGSGGGHGSTPSLS